MISEHFTNLWLLTRDETIRLANTIPVNFDITWTPFPGLKSFGEICRHIVGSTYSILLRYFNYPIVIPEDIKHKEPLNKDRFITELRITNEAVINLLAKFELDYIEKTFKDEDNNKRTYLWGLWLLLDHEAHLPSLFYNK